MTMPAVVVRLGPDEVERFRSIRLASLAQAPYAFGTTHAEAAARPESEWRAQLAEIPVFVAVLDGADVGIVRAAPYEDDPRKAWLISMWVAPSARGQGIGEQLVDAVRGWAIDEARFELLLDVVSDNERAIAFYERVGFRPTGERERQPPPREHLIELRYSLDLWRGAMQ